ncbi:MAG TPA: hypothetical protein PLZ86_05900, partial [bacterium]|nr:hypothetical protein [bacterium]
GGYMETKDADRIKVGEILAEAMANKITLDDAKKRIKEILPFVIKGFDEANDAPELEMIIKHELKWQ